ncbi:MAG: nuclear transport factor 2 family protein [Bacteroidetes bacterium]|nr:nuclear transport factor 2 family protein [Bacteroidota bacterium]
METKTHPAEIAESVLSKESENVLAHHLHSFGHNDLDALMSAYTEESALITHVATYSGLREIKGFYEQFMKHFKKEGSNFWLDKLVISDELVFITWHAETPSLEVPLATDTFIIKEGKIFQQTFAAQLNFLN